MDFSTHQPRTTPGPGFGAAVSAAERQSADGRLIAKAARPLGPPTPVLTLTGVLEVITGDARELFELAGSLEGRLAPILRPSNPTPNDASGAGAVSPVADHLMSHHVNLRATIRQLTDVLERIDL